MLNVYTDLDDSRVGFEVVPQIPEPSSQRLSSPQSEDLEKADRDYYQQLLDIKLIRKIDGQLVELESFSQTRTEKSIWLQNPRASRTFIKASKPYSQYQTARIELLAAFYPPIVISFDNRSVKDRALVQLQHASRFNYSTAAGYGYRIELTHTDIYIYGWCPDLRPEDALSVDHDNPSIHQLRLTLWTESRLETHRLGSARHERNGRLRPGQQERAWQQLVRWAENLPQLEDYSSDVLQVCDSTFSKTKAYSLRYTLPNPESEEETHGPPTPRSRLPVSPPLDPNTLETNIVHYKLEQSGKGKAESSKAAGSSRNNRPRVRGTSKGGVR